MAHDRAGNMTKVPKKSFSGHFDNTFDAWKRLVRVADGSSTVQENAYDAVNRRVIKRAYAGGVLDHTCHFYYSDSWQVLEERKNTETRADRQFAWGIRYIDDLILRDRDADGSASIGALGSSGSSLEKRLYALQDPNWNVTAIADPNGDIQERYAYAAHGKSTFLRAAFGSRGVPRAIAHPG